MITRSPSGLTLPKWPPLPPYRTCADAKEVVKMTAVQKRIQLSSRIFALLSSDIDLAARTVPNMLHVCLVDIAPPPIFSRLEGLDNRMVRSVEVLGGVLIRR